jgi:hypothetical protein
VHRQLERGAAEHPLLAEALEISLVVFALSGPFYPVAYHFYFYLMAGLALAARAVTNDVLARVTP